MDTCLARNLSLYILPPKMAQTVRHYWPSCQLWFNDTKDPGSLSKLIRCPCKVEKKGDKSDPKKVVLCKHRGKLMEIKLWAVCLCSDLNFLFPAL